MCQLCNVRLMAAAQSASLLARAAKDLYDMNDHVNSAVLAKAAGNLFVEPKVSGETNVKPDASKEATDPASGTGEAQADAPKRPQGFFIDDEGMVFINGAALGRVVVLGKPTRH